VGVGSSPQHTNSIQGSNTHLSRCMTEVLLETMWFGLHTSCKLRFWKCNAVQTRCLT